MRRAAAFPWLVFSLGLFTSVAPLAAQAPDNSPAFIGQWDLFLEGSNKSCRLTLRGEQVHGGFYVGIPAVCRRALPVLSNVIAWIAPFDNHLDLADVYGAPLLDFSMEEAGRLTASGANGETYRLEFIEAAPARQAIAPGAALRGAGPAPAVTAATVAQAAVAPAAQAPAAVALRPAEVAGRYAVLRDGGRDTGCMVTLDAQPGPQGVDKAFLAPACRDQGIVIFDPVGWRIMAGRLVLTARKGHTAQLERQADGTWLKDAGQGKSLTLKKF